MADGVDEKTYSAKQVATRIGTDAKQLRKFFRDPNSGYKAVGQGGRYDFPEKDIPAIKKAFDEWNSTKVRRNRSPQKKLATAAGLIPGQRKESPGTETPPRPRRRSPEQLFKEGLHGNALDNDTFSDRTAGIGVRVKRHGLVPNQQGRLVEEPDHLLKAREAKTEELDFSKVFEPQVDPDDPEVELELEDDGDIEDTEIDFDDDEVEEL